MKNEAHSIAAKLRKAAQGLEDGSVVGLALVAVAADGSMSNATAATTPQVGHLLIGGMFHEASSLSRQLGDLVAKQSPIAKPAAGAVVAIDQTRNREN